MRRNRDGARISVSLTDTVTGRQVATEADGQARRFFQWALELDPLFARGHAGRRCCRYSVGNAPVSTSPFTRFGCSTENRCATRAPIE